MTIKDWREIAREPVADCRVFSVERSIAESPVDGTRHEFYRIHSGSWAQIVPVTKEGDVVLVRQYRHGARRVTLEMPAGLVDPGEDPRRPRARMSRGDGLSGPERDLARGRVSEPRAVR